MSMVRFVVRPHAQAKAIRTFRRLSGGAHGAPRWARLVLPAPGGFKAAGRSPALVSVGSNPSPPSLPACHLPGPVRASRSDRPARPDQSRLLAARFPLVAAVPWIHLPCRCGGLWGGCREIALAPAEHHARERRVGPMEAGQPLRNRRERRRLALFGNKQGLRFLANLQSWKLLRD